MKTMLPLLISAHLLAIAAAASPETFDAAKLGGPPTGWTASQTGKGTANWRVEPDSSAPSKPNVHKQSGVATYPVCLRNDTQLKDGFVEVKFKAVSGKEDQAGGVVWRAQDADNYFVCRANALKDNVRIYHIVKGKRTQFGNADVKVPARQWHTLRVGFSGAKTTVFFNGKRLFEAEDQTFTQAGRVGVWTKADSVTLFDDFTFGGNQMAGHPRTMIASSRCSTRSFPSTSSRW